MGGVIPRFQHGGPVTFEVVELVKGGQLVEARAAGLVGVAAAGSVKCLGIATKDAIPTTTGASVDAFGNPVQSLVEITKYVAAGSDAVYPVTYAANTAFGALLVCAALGQVTPYVAAIAGAVSNADQIIGRCYEPLGVLAGATGLVKITV